MQNAVFQQNDEVTLPAEGPSLSLNNLHCTIVWVFDNWYWNGTVNSVVRSKTYGETKFITYYDVYRGLSIRKTVISALGEVHAWRDEVMYFKRSIIGTVRYAIARKCIQTFLHGV